MKFNNYCKHLREKTTLLGAAVGHPEVVESWVGKELKEETQLCAPAQCPGVRDLGKDTHQTFTA